MNLFFRVLIICSSAASCFAAEGRSQSSLPMRPRRVAPVFDLVPLSLPTATLVRSKSAVPLHTSLPPAPSPPPEPEPAPSVLVSEKTGMVLEKLAVASGVVGPDFLDIYSERQRNPPPWSFEQLTAWLLGKRR